MSNQLTVTIVVALSLAFAGRAHSQTSPLTNLGMVGVKTDTGFYLQAHDSDGEMHASNPNRNEEETWFLIEVDKQKHIYALQNWRNGKFMSKKPESADGCAPADSVILGKNEQWILVSGQPFGVLNAVAIKSVADGTFLGRKGPGNDVPHCGGEVAAAGKTGPDSNPRWAGWWVLESETTAPTAGKDAWNTAGSVSQGIWVEIKPLVTNALMAALASGGG